MDPTAVAHEVEAALLLAAITLALSVLSAYLYKVYRKPWLVFWSVGWGLYALRIGVIITFLETSNYTWLYWHQAATGWTALALLVAALSFANPTKGYRRWLIPAVVFPVIWAYLAIFVLDDFILAATTTVVLLAAATGWTGWTFIRYRRRTGSGAGRLMGVTFVLWAIHHLDYPILRARGLLTPWSYYLDIAFILATAAGMLLLVVEDLRRGLNTLSALSGDLQRGAATDDALGRLLERPLALTGVLGSAICFTEPDGTPGPIARGAGISTPWRGSRLSGAMLDAVTQAIGGGKPTYTTAAEAPSGDRTRLPFTAVLPIIRGSAVRGALLIAGSTSDPFTALDESFLVALGQQVGAALENEDLYQRLAARTLELERLSLKMIQQHEDQRHRLSLELHDETAQVFSALKLQLGLMREAAAAVLHPRFDLVTGLVDEGMRSIRRITEDLRPSLLDDLGLIPALRALTRDLEARTGIVTVFSAEILGDRPPNLDEDTELVLFRALQEALSNVVRHAEATRVWVDFRTTTRQVSLAVADDGRGIGGHFEIESLPERGHMGLAGMQERVSAIEGELTVSQRINGGTAITIVLPTNEVTQ